MKRKAFCIMSDYRFENQNPGQPHHGDNCLQHAPGTHGLLDRQAEEFLKEPKPWIIRGTENQAASTCSQHHKFGIHTGHGHHRCGDAPCSQGSYRCTAASRTNYCCHRPRQQQGR